MLQPRTEERTAPNNPGEIAPGITRVPERAPLINVYLVDDVLIDAGRRWDRKRILKAIEGRELSVVALTHVHADHQGMADAVCSSRGIPLACHEADVERMEREPTREELKAQHPVARLVMKAWQGPPHPVERALEEGDEIAGFRVVHAPGHTAGSVVYFRESDRVAIAGDVIRNLNYATLRPKLAEPPSFFNEDSAENRRSIRKLADLQPSLILPGHGGAVRDMDEFKRFAEALPAD
jgi:hydroxyacylglutathione hydrolase